MKACCKHKVNKMLHKLPLPRLCGRAALLAVLALAAAPLRAQVLPGPVGADSLSSTLVPVIAYSSDEGWVGGAVYSRISYRGDDEPFFSHLQASALVSTKGFVEIQGRREQITTFGRDLRSEAEIFLNRYAFNNYFGVGNGTSFSRERWEDEYYFFDDLGVGGAFRVRHPLYRKGRSRLDLSLGLASEYHISYVRKEDSKFFQALPNGDEGGWVNLLESGVIWENRDSEFDPRRGSRLDLRVRFAPHGLSDFDFTTLRLTMRHYFRLLGFVTVAQRLQGRHAGGDVPYWELSRLGDDHTLRGFALNRFQGRSSLSYTLELRTWLVEFPAYGLKFGGQLFTDAGRVFTSRDDAGDLLEGYHQTFGFGGAMSAFNPDFILRGDIGFSRDMTRLYIGIGYMF